MMQTRYRNDIKVKYTKLCPSLHLFHTTLQCRAKKIQGWGFVYYLHFYIIPTSLAYFFDMPSYFFIHFNVFILLFVPFLPNYSFSILSRSKTV